MAVRQEPVEEPSRMAGGCVLVVLGVAGTAAVFVAAPDVGVLAVWVVGGVAVWRSARRMSGLSATPPPRGVAPESDEAARRRLKKARGVYDPNGVMCTYHPTPEREVNGS